MAMLVVYCLKDISLASISGWLPGAISVAAVVGLHVWKRNTLLSIIGGTVCYMVLIRIIL
jgi:branched-subunit amino acid transport protein AzlD